jgi:hypothetical protein
MARFTKLTDLDVSVRGVLNTISDRLDGVDDDELVTFALSAEGDASLKNIEDHLPDLDLYFSALYDEGPEQAEELFADNDYARRIGRPIDQVEDAFVAWSLEHSLLAPAPKPGPRGRLSGLAERQLSLS